MGWTVRRDLCHAALSRWVEWYFDTHSVQESFAWADLSDDDL